MITDWTTGTIHIFNENGDELHQFAATLEAPAYVTVSKQTGNIIVSDWKNHLIRVFSPKGEFLAQYGGAGDGALEGQLNHPYGVCTDNFGHIIVADNWNHRITLLEQNCRFIRHLLTKDDGIEWPQQVGIDSKGNLVVAELGGLVKVFQYIA